MASDDICIEFDRQPAEYHTGEDITGRVVVRPGADLTCERLVLEQWWSAGSLSHAEESLDWRELLKTEDCLDVRQGQTAVLCEAGVWQADEEYAFEFCLPAQGAPYDYDGSLFDACWRLAVYAEGVNRMLGAPHALARYRQLPGDETTYDPRQGGAVPQSQSTPDLRTSQGASSPLVGPITVLILQLLAVWGGSAILTRPKDGMFWELVLFVGGFVLIPLLGRMSGMAVAAERIGDVDCNVDRDAAAPGDSVRCRVHLPIHLPVTLKAISATLEVVEGSNHVHVDGNAEFRRPEKVHTDEVVSQHTVTFQGSEDVHLEEAADFVEDIRLPDDIPYSLYTKNHSVSCRLVVHIHTADEDLDYKRELPLRVVPEAAVDDAVQMTSNELPAFSLMDNPAGFDLPKAAEDERDHAATIRRSFVAQLSFYPVAACVSAGFLLHLARGFDVPYKHVALQVEAGVLAAGYLALFALTFVRFRRNQAS